MDSFFHIKNKRRWNIFTISISNDSHIATAANHQTEYEAKTTVHWLLDGIRKVNFNRVGNNKIELR